MGRVLPRNVERVARCLENVAVSPELRDVNARRLAPCVRAEDYRSLCGIQFVDDGDLPPKRAREEVRHLLGGKLYRPRCLWRDGNLHRRIEPDSRNKRTGRRKRHHYGNSLLSHHFDLPCI